MRLKISLRQLRAQMGVIAIAMLIAACACASVLGLTLVGRNDWQYLTPGQVKGARDKATERVDALAAPQRPITSFTPLETASLLPERPRPAVAFDDYSLTDSGDVADSINLFFAGVGSAWDVEFDLTHDQYGNREAPSDYRPENLAGGYLAPGGPGQDAPYWQYRSCPDFLSYIGDRPQSLNTSGVYHDKPAFELYSNQFLEDVIPLAARVLIGIAFPPVAVVGRIECRPNDIAPADFRSTFVTAYCTVFGRNTCDAYCDGRPTSECPNGDPPYQWVAVEWFGTDIVWHARVWDGGLDDGTEGDWSVGAAHLDADYHRNGSSHFDEARDLIAKAFTVNGDLEGDLKWFVGGIWEIPLYNVDPGGCEPASPGGEGCLTEPSGNALYIWLIA